MRKRALWIVPFALTITGCDEGVTQRAGEAPADVAPSALSTKYDAIPQHHTPLPDVPELDQVGADENAKFHRAPGQLD